MKARAFERNELGRLLDVEPGRVHLTITLPTHRFGREALQGGATLDRLLDEAERRLLASGREASQTAALLAPLRELCRDDEFWARQDEGLLLLRSGDETLCYRLPHRVDESVVVGERFALRALLPLLGAEERYFVVALSAKETRVVEATPGGSRRVPIPGLPPSLEEALGYDQYYSEIDRHVGGPAALGRKRSIVHGHGDQDEERESVNLAAYFRQIAQAMKKALPPRVPWVLAAVERHLPIFREAAGEDDRLLGLGIPGNPELLGDQELCERARPLVAEASERRRAEALRRLERQAGTPKVATELSTLLAAAHHGRVELLFLEPNVRHWGSFEPRTGRLEVHREPRPGDDELIESALFHTLRAGGEAWEVPGGALPVRSDTAALLRY
jgi:hypothetical protein